MRGLNILTLLAAAAPLALIPGAAGAQYAGVPAANPDADELASQMRLLAANPQNLTALIRAGELTLRLDDPTAAAGFFARAERIDPRNARIKAGLGSLLVGEERPGEALRRFAEAETLGANPGSFAADRGLAYDLIGEQERAQRDYRAALRYATSDETSRRYALSLGISGKRDQAFAQLDSLLRRSDRGAWRDRAFILAMSGDRPGAERIATSMLPGGMAQGLQPFFERLPSLSAADRAFAVHFGEIRPTPERLADARLIPPLAALGPDPYAPVEVAAVRPAVVRQDKRDDRKRKKHKGVDIDVATTPPPQPLPPPPTYLAATNPRDRSAMIQPLPGRAPATTAFVQPLPSRATATTAFVQPLPATKASSAFVQPLPRTTVTPTPTRPVLPPVSVAAIAAPPRAMVIPVETNTRVAVASPPAPAPIETIQPRALPSSAPTGVTASRPPTAAPTLAVAIPPSASAASTVAAVVPAPAPVAPAALAPQTTLVPPPQVLAESVPVASAVPADTMSVPVIAAPAPVTASALPKPSPVRSEDSILASIIAGITVPSSERIAAPAPLPPVKIARAETRQVPTEKPETPVERVSGDKAKADAAKAADAKKLADKKTADAKRAADLKKVADAKKAAEEKAKNDPKKREPSRIWVQVAGGANEDTLPKAWAAVREKAPATFKGKQAWTTPLRATNRVLTGPFKTDEEARAFVNQLAKQGVSAFSFTSDAGQQVTKLPGK